jgi:hypothetical protein
VTVTWAVSVPGSATFTVAEPACAGISPVPAAKIYPRFAAGCRARTLSGRSPSTDVNEYPPEPFEKPDFGVTPVPESSTAEETAGDPFA